MADKRHNDMSEDEIFPMTLTLNQQEAEQQVADYYTALRGYTVWMMMQQKATEQAMRRLSIHEPKGLNR